jgi:hypothetical protein
MRLPLILLAGLCGLGGCGPTVEGTEAPSAASGGRPCFFLNQVDNFRSDGNTTLYVRARREGVFRIDTSGACFDVESANGIALSPPNGIGSSRVCVNDSVDVALPPGGFGPRQCRARVAAALTAEEVEALPSRARP